MHSQIEQLDLPKHQKMVWMLDCWFIDKNHEFLDWIKEDHPNILVIVIPTNCTIELQPTYVILQRPLKHAFKVEFNTWTTSVIKEWIDNG